MAAGAADLVDHILPRVADYRQWTLSFPRWLRIRLLRDKALVSAVLLVFVRVVSAYHRRRARQRGIAGGQTGAACAARSVPSLPPVGSLTLLAPSVNRFGSRHAQAAFAAPKSRMDRPAPMHTRASPEQPERR